MDNELEQKIIREQDLLTIYAYNNFNKSLGLGQEYVPGIRYRDIKEIMSNNQAILDGLSVKNLYNLYASICYGIDNEEVCSRILAQIDKKLEHEDFFVEDLDKDVYLKPIHTANVYSKLGQFLFDKINPAIKEGMQVLKGTPYERIGRNIKYYTDAANFLKYYKQGIFTPEKMELINKMLDKNPDALRFVNFGLFKDDIFDLGPEFCIYMSKFPTLNAQLLVIEEHNPELFSALKSRFKSYENIKDKLDEIEILVTYSARNTFELQGKPINIDELVECAYRNCNDINAINVPYGSQYQQRLRERMIAEYDKVSKQTWRTDLAERKLNVYTNAAYSIPLNKIQTLLKEYGSDIDNLPGVSEKSKQLFAKLRNVVDINDENKIDELFRNYSQEYTATDIKETEYEISRAAAKDFSREFRRTNEDLQNEDLYEVSYIGFAGQQIPQIKLKGKFNLLVHSTDAEFIEAKTEKATDYVEEWSNGKNKNNHIISTTYINQDFMGMAPVGNNGVRYAFADISDEQIKLMGVSDLNTYSINFAYDSASKQYMSAKTLANNSRRVYSEFGIERESTLPNYVVLADDDSPEVMVNSYKAAMQFGIPIIKIDKRVIEQEQIHNLQGMLENFKQTHDSGTLRKLINTYETNMAGWLLNREGKDSSFTYMINNSRFEQDFADMRILIEDEIYDYLSISDNKNITDSQTREVIDIILDENDLYEGCNEEKPISKTAMTLDARKILGQANRTLEFLGQDHLKVNLSGDLPTRKEYDHSIEEYVRSSLSGIDAVTKEEVNDMELFLEGRADREVPNDIRDNK